MTKRILIIGGTGYIGSALYKHLIAQSTVTTTTSLVGTTVETSRKFDVDTVDLEWFGNFVNPKNINMDYRHLTREQLAKYDAVILLAGYSSPTISINSGVGSTFENNVSNFVNLVSKMSIRQKLIYAGSASVYNGIPDENVTEDYALLAPKNIYDCTKQDIDRLIAMYPDVEYYGLRFATVNGISANLRNDIMINAMAGDAVNTGAIFAFNTDIRKGILYLGDLCRAIEAILDCVQDRRGVYNLTSFNGTVGDIAEGVARTTDSTLTVAKQVPALEQTYDFSMSAKKFEETFNFRFNGSIEVISAEIANHIKNTHASGRKQGIKYV